MPTIKQRSAMLAQVNAKSFRDRDSNLTVIKIEILGENYYEKGSRES